MSDEERMEQCQREITRLHRVCRLADAEIERYKVLLYNAIVYIAEATDSLSEQGTAEQSRWYEETLGITAEELESIGIDWFKENN